MPSVTTIEDEWKPIKASLASLRHSIHNLTDEVGKQKAREALHNFADALNAIKISKMVELLEEENRGQQD